MKLKIRSAYTREAGEKINTGETRTEQSHKKETDMNFILREYSKTGFIKHSKENQGRYDDVTVQDFQTAMTTVTNAQNMFRELPAQVRGRFGNNPGGFLEFVQNPANEAEMHKMGILRGNDGVDIAGTAINVPTQAHWDALVLEQAQARKAAEEATQAVSEGEKSTGGKPVLPPGT